MLDPSLRALLNEVDDETLNLWYIIFTFVIVYMILRSHPDETEECQNLVFEELMGIIRDANIDFDQLARRAPLNAQELRRRLEEAMQEKNTESSGNNQEAAEEDPKHDDFGEEDDSELWNPEKAWNSIEPVDSQQDEHNLNALLDRALVLPLPDDDDLDLNEDVQLRMQRVPQQIDRYSDRINDRSQSHPLAEMNIDYFPSEEENAWPRTNYLLQKCKSRSEAALADEGSWPREGYLYNLPLEMLCAVQNQPQPQNQDERLREKQQNVQIQDQIIEQLDQAQDLNQLPLRRPRNNYEVGGGDNNLKLMIRPKREFIEDEQPQAANEEVQPRRNRARFNRSPGGKSRPRRAPTPPPAFGLQYNDEVELNLLNQEANEELNQEEPHNE